MKKINLLFLCLLLCGCAQENEITTSANNTSFFEQSSTSSVEDSITSSIEESISSDIGQSSESSETSSSLKEKLTINEILSLGEKFDEGEKSSLITFEGKYVKIITDNNDKLMLFVDNTDYVAVRVKGGLNDYLDNRYLNCYYSVEGYITKNNGKVEVDYQYVSNITSESEKHDYSNIAIQKNSISEVYQDIDKIKLNSKYSGYGEIVSFEAIIVASDESDANKKVVVYDENKTLTIIDSKKICSKEDMGQKYVFTGILNVLKSSPALLLLDKKYVEKVDVSSLNYENVSGVTPSYFSKWYYVKDKINIPTYEDYSKLYKITGYITYDTDRTTNYNIGMVDNKGNSLSDNGNNKSIKGIYLMNNLGLEDKDLYYSPFNDYLNEDIKVTFYASLHQFDTQNHAWKVFAINTSISGL